MGSDSTATGRVTWCNERTLLSFDDWLAAPGMAPIVAGLPVEILASCDCQGVRPARTSRPY